MVTLEERATLRGWCEQKTPTTMILDRVVMRLLDDLEDAESEIERLDKLEQAYP